MTTHERWSRPPRSPTIVGSAVETIVWSSAARNMPSISAPKTGTSARPVSTSGSPLRAHARSPSYRERKTASGASSWVSVPSATARAPASSSAPKTRTASPVEASAANSPRGLPALDQRAQRLAEHAAAALARRSSRRRAGRELRERVALGDVQPGGAQPAQRLGGAALVQPAGGERLLALLDRLRVDRRDQRLARREVAVDRRAADARGGGHVAPSRRSGRRRAAARRPRRCGARCVPRRRAGTRRAEPSRHECSTK